MNLLKINFETAPKIVRKRVVSFEAPTRTNEAKITPQTDLEKPSETALKLL